MSGCLGLQRSLRVAKTMFKTSRKTCSRFFSTGLVPSAPSSSVRVGTGRRGSGGRRLQKERERDCGPGGLHPRLCPACSRPCPRPALSFPPFPCTPPYLPLFLLPPYSLSPLLSPPTSLPDSLTTHPRVSELSLCFLHPQTTLGPGHKPISQMSRQGRGRGTAESGRGTAESDPSSVKAGSWASCRICGPQCKMKPEGSSFEED